MNVAQQIAQMKRDRNKPSRASRRVEPHGSLPHPSGVMAAVVCTDPAAHLELIELCAKWHRRKNNSLYIDGEQSLSSYRANNAVRGAAEPRTLDGLVGSSEWKGE